MDVPWLSKWTIWNSVSVDRKNSRTFHYTPPDQSSKRTEKQKEEKPEEKPDEPRVRRRMIEKPKDGFENPEMYKKHERKSNYRVIFPMISFDQVVKRLFIIFIRLYPW